MTLKDLKPSLIWSIFDEITQVPRPSKKEEKIRQWLLDFAAKNNIAVKTDEIGNVVMSKPATPGHENAPGIILQAHMDMVCESNEPFDFENTPISTRVDGEWVWANGTTLGADNGIGMAGALAALVDDTLVHGPIEALFTVDEETGLTGANNLGENMISGSILLNLDSEDDAEIFVGCAGGVDTTCTFSYTPQAAPQDKQYLKISVADGQGGHSGCDIHLGRANANKLLARFIWQVAQKQELTLAEIEGGNLRNAIPRESMAVVLVEESKLAAVKAEVEAFEKTAIAELAGSEDSISIKAAECAAPAECMDTQTSWQLVAALTACPDGVDKMSLAMEGLVQTSNNMARVVYADGKVKVQCLTRSSVRSEKEALADSIKACFELAGAEVVLSGSYDGWNPNMESPILKAMLSSYEALYGKAPAVTAIHAGLECGIIGGKYPNLDMISFGPTICYPHSPDEKVEIASVAKFYDFLLHTLNNAPKK